MDLNLRNRGRQYKLFIYVSLHQCQNIKSRRKSLLNNNILSDNGSGSNHIQVSIFLSKKQIFTSSKLVYLNLIQRYSVLQIFVYYYLMRNNISTSKNAYLSIPLKNYIGYTITALYLEKSFKLLWAEPIILQTSHA